MKFAVSSGLRFAVTVNVLPLAVSPISLEASVSVGNISPSAVAVMSIVLDAVTS